MAGNNKSVAKKLKEMRERAGISMSVLAEALGRSERSGYQYFEDRFKKEYLPVEFVKKIKPYFLKAGIPAREIDSLAGIDSLQGFSESGTPKFEVGKNISSDKDFDQDVLIEAMARTDNFITEKKLKLPNKTKYLLACEVYSSMLVMAKHGKKSDLKSDVIELLLYKLSS